MEVNRARRGFSPCSAQETVAPSAAGTQRARCFWKPSSAFGTRCFAQRLQRSTRGSATRPCMWRKGNDVPGRNCLQTEVSSKATEQAEVLTGAGRDPELLQSSVYRGADGCHPHTGTSRGIQLYQSLLLSQLSKPNCICSEQAHIRS